MLLLLYYFPQRFARQKMGLTPREKFDKEFHLLRAPICGMIGAVHDFSAKKGSIL